MTALDRNHFEFLGSAIYTILTSEKGYPHLSWIYNIAGGTIADYLSFTAERPSLIISLFNLPHSDRLPRISVQVCLGYRGKFSDKTYFSVDGLSVPQLKQLADSIFSWASSIIG